jgi:hypothetical protein
LYHRHASLGRSTRPWHRDRLRGRTSRPTAGIALRKLCDRHSLGCCCVEKGAVASDHDDVRIADSIGSSEVDSVIPAQSTIFSQFASAASEGVIDFDKVDLFEQGVELSDSIT